MMEREMEFKRWRRSCKKGCVAGKWVRCWKMGTLLENGHVVGKWVRCWKRGTLLEKGDGVEKRGTEVDKTISLFLKTSILV